MSGYTKKDLATIAGYSYRRLYDIDMSLPPDGKLFVETPDSGGKYDLPTFVQRWVKYNVNNAEDSIEDLDTVKAKHEIVKTRKTELEVARMEGSLVDVQDVQKLWGDIASMTMQSLIHVPSKVAPLLVMMGNVEQIADIIDAQIRESLNMLADAPVPEYATIADGNRGETKDDREEDDEEV